jgi:hypothetical protein
MNDAVKLTDLEISDPKRRAPRRGKTCRKTGISRHAAASAGLASASLVSLPRETGDQGALDSRSGVDLQSIQPGELDRVHRSPFEMTPENHPRTARLLASRRASAIQFQLIGMSANPFNRNRNRP